MSNNEKLDEILSALEKKRTTPSTAVVEITDASSSDKTEMGLKPVEKIRETICIDNQYQENLGLFDKMKINNLEREKKLEAQRIIFDTQIERLKHQVVATERQSKAYWDAKSVDFTEGLKTYAQQNTEMLEKARLENKSKTILDIYKTTHEKMLETAESSLPDSIKQEVVEKLIAIRNDTISRIENNDLARKYDLD